MHNGNWIPICYDSIALATSSLLCVCGCGQCSPNQRRKAFLHVSPNGESLSCEQMPYEIAALTDSAFMCSPFSTFRLLIFRRFPDAVFCCCSMCVLLLSLLLLLVCLMLFTFICRVHYSKSFRCRSLTCLR